MSKDIQEWKMMSMMTSIMENKAANVTGRNRLMGIIASIGMIPNCVASVIYIADVRMNFKD